MKQIFITRDLSEATLFRQLLSAKGFVVYGESLIKFEAVDFGALPATDWVFFYSKKAARYFFMGLKMNGQLLDKDLKIGVIGPGTSRYLEEKNVPVHFTGDGHPESTAKAFLRLSQGKRVLFPRAEHSRKSIQDLLGDRIRGVDLVVYKNEPRSGFHPPLVDYLIVTSPLNARVWFDRPFPNRNIRTLAIGNTTARTLEKLQVSSVRVASAPSERALAEEIIAWDVSRPSF